jgi:hypothetical protein
VDAGGHSLKALQFIKKTFPNSLASQGLRVRQGARDRARADPLRCCAVRFFRAAVAAGNHDYPVAIHGAGRAADEADHTIGCAAAARTHHLFHYRSFTGWRSRKIQLSL